MNQKKVLIVGAGPVGLAAALFLQSQGVASHIIDKKLTYPAFSKALGTNPRSLTLLNKIGITEHLIKNGNQIHGLNAFYDQKRLFTNHFLDRPIPGNQFPYMLTIPQSKIEQIFQNKLKEKGIKVDRGVELLNLKQIGNEVAITLKKQNNVQDRKYDIVFAADGKQSPVRNLLDIKFPGIDFPREIYIRDVQMTGLPNYSQVFVYLSRNNTAALLPFNDKTVRFISTSLQPQNLIPKKYIIQKELWRASFKISHKIAPVLNQGNVYLGGDAAHIHSPVGGRGMNLGIEDAYIFSQLFRSGKLERYNQVRLPEIRKVVIRVRRLTDFLLGTDSKRSLIPYVGPVANVIMKRKMFEFLLGLDHDI